jgi:hypothetical protein
MATNGDNNPAITPVRFKSPLKSADFRHREGNFVTG